MTGSWKYAAVARASGEPSAGSAPAPSSASTIAEVLTEHGGHQRGLGRAR